MNKNDNEIFKRLRQVARDNETRYVMLHKVKEREDDEVLGIIKDWFGDNVTVTNDGFRFNYSGYDWIVRKMPLDVLYINGGRATEIGYRAEGYIPGESDYDVACEEISLYDLLETIEGAGRF